MEWASEASSHSEWKGRKTGYNIFHPHQYMVEGWFILCVCLCCGKCWITFQPLYQFHWDFQGLLAWLRLTYGWHWVVPLPCSHWVGLGQVPVLFTGVHLLHGHWSHWVMSYHFRKHLTSRTKMWEQIFYAWPQKRTCTRNASSPWSLVVPGHDIPFWKALAKPNKLVRADFWIGFVFLGNPVKLP